MIKKIALAAALSLTACSERRPSQATPDHYAWESYLGGPERNHYTRLSQITAENVSHLEVAWRYFTPDSGQMQMNPVIRNGLLYGSDSRGMIFALNAGTGQLEWHFRDTLQTQSTSRGVAYWEGEKGDRRILVTTGPYLWALDADTGNPVTSFGKDGRIDLHDGLPEIAAKKYIGATTPGTVFKDMIIISVRVAEGTEAAPGDVGAFDVRTGEVRWTFHTIPHPGEQGYEAWENREAYRNEGIGGANNWAGMALDEQRGIVYVPTGSIAPDFYGGDRKGDNRYANCLLALNASDGRLLWYYQFTHHDVWDRDLPAPPNLISVDHDGEKIDAVAQITKQGYVFLFDRETGEPLFNIEEVPVPESELEGEALWPTQPRPVKPDPFARQAQDLKEEDISRDAPDRDSLLALFRNSDRRWYAPGSSSPVLLLPGYDGGAEWGGAGADPDQGILYVNANEMPWIHQLEDLQDDSRGAASAGELLYDRYCAACHLSNLKGMPESGYPSLEGLRNRLNKESFSQMLSTGKGMMPGFPQLDEKEIDLLYNFLGGQDKSEFVGEQLNVNVEQRYRHKGYRKFLDQSGLPAIAPPWGTLSAIDLNSGEYIWRIPFGEEERTTAYKGEQPTGTENYGGPIISENGLLMIAATRDGFFRVYDRHTGELLWKYRLPAPSFATPATYEINGKQFVVVVCGGEKLGTSKGNQVIALSLPDDLATEPENSESSPDNH
ncbi:outer membrane protein assembly factor BamB family protein [Robertkochia aurantiaca]|uniref:outer membrane protein assembly factor BamB family protein n=1 Tax=Robertkochia aurantiaca TaxID=2873700 RepID=UPI001CCBA7DE|nr:PQQ-binding-like beta-propeller repeat protein [Robertkochia sp. 3YJGBD-33]